MPWLHLPSKPSRLCPVHGWSGNRSAVERARALPGWPRSARRALLPLGSAASSALERCVAALALGRRQSRRSCSSMRNPKHPLSVAPVCRDPRRDTALLCVFEESRDAVVARPAGGFPAAPWCWEGSAAPTGFAPNLGIDRWCRSAAPGSTRCPSDERDAEARPPLPLAERLEGFRPANPLAHGLPVGGER